MIFASFYIAVSLLVAPPGAEARDLAPGHWLTCWGGADSVRRTGPALNRNSTEEQINQLIPEYRGSYSFEVKDTWEEWVTHFGTSCSHCGSYCTSNNACYCNSCSWQELETFYRPWSIQKADWHVKFVRNEKYQESRKKWIVAGKHPVAKSPENLQALFEFDPDRPTEYYLFPGEVETLFIANTGAEQITPTVSVKNARNDYVVQTRTNGFQGALSCKAQDLKIESTVQAQRRILTTSPNSIEFRPGWLKAETDSDGKVLSEPGAFDVVDLGATYYEGQNIFDHYKDTRVALYLREMDRAWWFDRKISKTVELRDNISIINIDQWAKKEGAADALFEVKADQLMRTPLGDSRFHLAPNKQFEICGRVLRKNNVYYKQTKMLGMLEAWSEANCMRFAFTPPPKQDLRSGTRKVRDFWTQYLFPLFPWW